MCTIRGYQFISPAENHFWRAKPKSSFFHGAWARNSARTRIHLARGKRGRLHYVLYAHLALSDRYRAGGMTRYGSRYFTITVTMFVFAATCVLVVGCGGTDGSSATRGSMPIARAQAIAFAGAVNVRAGDLPGLRGGQPPAKREITRGPFAPAMERCDPTVVRVGKVVGIISPHFTRPTTRKPSSSMSLNFTFDRRRIVRSVRNGKHRSGVQGAGGDRQRPGTDLRKALLGK